MIRNITPIRWTSAAIVEAEKNFRRVQGWRDIKNLVTVMSELENNREAIAERVATKTASRRSEKINSERDDFRVRAGSLAAETGEPRPGIEAVVVSTRTSALGAGRRGLGGLAARCVRGR